MSSMEIQMSCVFCRDELDISEVELHGCFLGRINEVRADENGVLFLLDSSDNGAEQLIVPSNNTDAITNLDELLITEVQKYPALYDHRIPIEQRSRAKRDSCWQEIYTNLQGQIPMADLPKKWKNERDKYLKARKEEKKYVPSGSAAPTKKPPVYKNYALMHFLNDIIKHKDTTCNLELPPLSDQIEDSQYDSSLSDLAPSSPSTSVCSASSLIANKSQIKRNFYTGKRQSTDIEEALLEAIRQPIQMPPPPVPTQFTPPSTPPLAVTEIEAFCRRLSASLQRLDRIDPSVRAEAEIELPQVLFKWEYGAKQKKNTI